MPTYRTDYQDVVAGRVREEEDVNARVWNRGGYRTATPAGFFEVGASKKANQKDPNAVVTENLQNDPGKAPADKDPKPELTTGGRGSHSVGSKTA
jgi:hypothetical protein